MSLKLVYKSSDLNPGPPALQRLDYARIRGDKPAIVYGWNLSPWVILICADGQDTPVTVAQPFCPFKWKGYLRAEALITKVDSGLMVPASPLAAADWRFWLEVSEFDQDLFPSPF